MMNVLSLHLRTHRFKDCKNLTFSYVQEYYTLVLRLFSDFSRVENGDSQQLSISPVSRVATLKVDSNVSRATT